MDPLLRASADRLIHHGGFLTYVAGHASALGIERGVAATGRTVRQTFAHLVCGFERDLVAVDDLLAGHGDALRSRGTADAARPDDADIVALLDRYAAARDALIERYAQLPPALCEARAAADGPTFAQVLLDWSGHAQRHALDFAEALPEIAFDPLLLDWALHAALPDSDRPRQQALRQRAREYYASLPPRDNEDDEEDVDDEDEEEVDDSDEAEGRR